MNDTLSRLIALAGRSPFNPKNVMEGYEQIANSPDPYKTYMDEARYQVNRIGRGYADWLGNPMNFVGMINPMSGVKTPASGAGQSFDEWSKGIGQGNIVSISERPSIKGKSREQMTHQELYEDNMKNMPDDYLSAIPYLMTQDILSKLRGDNGN